MSVVGKDTGLWMRKKESQSKRVYRCQSVLFFELRYLVKSVLRLETSILSSYCVSTNLRLTATTSVVLSFWTSFHPSGDFRILGWRRAFLGQSLLFCMSACGDLRKVSGLPVLTRGRRHTQAASASSRAPGSAALPVTGPQSCEGCSHSCGFCSLLGIALENSALVSSSKQTILSGNLLGPSHGVGWILGLIRKKPLWSLNEIRSSASVYLSVTWD